MIRQLTAVSAAALLAGCAAQKPVINEYTYDSQVHSGTVYVHDTSYVDGNKCPSGWREAEQAAKNGLPPMVGMTLNVKVTVTEKGVERELPILVTTGDGPRITVKDYQEAKAELVGAETNGIVQQGELFEYPAGYFLRAAKPEAIQDEFSLCLGVDRMYSVPAIVQGGAPILRLDRLNVLLNAERDEVKTYTLGTNERVTIQVSVTAK